MTPEWRSYLVINGFQWLLVALIGLIAHQQLGVSWVLVLVVVLGWIGKDLVAYPFLRRYYRSEPSAQRMIGLHGVVLTPLSPRGLIRVRGEIWQAEYLGGQALPEGTQVYVRDMSGLLLHVEPR